MKKCTQAIRPGVEESLDRGRQNILSTRLGTKKCKKTHKNYIKIWKSLTDTSLKHQISVRGYSQTKFTAMGEGGSSNVNMTK